MGELEAVGSGVFLLEELEPASEPAEVVSLKDVELVSTRCVAGTLHEALVALCDPSRTARLSDAGAQLASWPALRPRPRRPRPPPLPRAALAAS